RSGTDVPNQSTLLHQLHQPEAGRPPFAAPVRRNRGLIRVRLVGGMLPASQQLSAQLQPADLFELSWSHLDHATHQRFLPWLSRSEAFHQAYVPSASGLHNTSHGVPREPWAAAV